MSQVLSLPTFDDVLAAEQRVAGVVRETPVLTHPALDAAAGAEVLVKAECLQVTGSFKIRGAMNRLSQIPEAGRKAGVVAFSSGNHAQGVARAARLLGMPALIVMPSDAPQVKVDGVLADGGEVHLYDRNTESREAISQELASARGAILVPSFDGGLITGVALAFEGLSGDTKFWAAEPEGHDDWARSLAAGEVIANAPGTRSFCDAILTPSPGELTFPLGQRLLAGGLVVSDAEVRAAMRFAFRHLKIVAEPGGAAALAAVLRGVPEGVRGGRVGVVVTGGNVDAVMFADVIGRSN